MLVFVAADADIEELLDVFLHCGRTHRSTLTAGMGAGHVSADDYRQTICPSWINSPSFGESGRGFFSAPFRRDQSIWSESSERADIAKLWYVRKTRKYLKISQFIIY